MTTRYGSSSELYWLEPQDLLKLAQLDEIDLPLQKQLESLTSDVVILLGDHRTGQTDKLVTGRAQLLSAEQNGQQRLPVAVVFPIRTPRWDFFSTFMKRRRETYRGYGTAIYHASAAELRAMNVERNIRSAETAYNYTNKRWHHSEQERVDKYAALVASMRKNGFDDQYPLEIMLRRSFGARDTFQQGHHRMAACFEAGVDRIALRFGAAGQASGVLMPALNWLAELKLNKQVKKR